MRLPSGTFSQSYAQDMALVRTKTTWVFLAVLMVFVFNPKCRIPLPSPG